MSDDIDVQLQRAGDSGPRASVRLAGEASVDALRQSAADACGLAPGRVRLIFRGRVLKDDERLAAAGVGPGAVVHVVERSDAEMAAEANGRPDGVQAAQQGAVRQGPGIVMHTMNVDGSPANVAAQITQGVMNAFLASMHGAAASEAAGDGTPGDAPERQRAPSRPQTARTRAAAVPVNAQAGALVRGHTPRVLANLEDEFVRITTLADGTDAVRMPPGAPSAADVRSHAHALVRNLAAFERAHAAMAAAAADIRASLESPGARPHWESVHALAGMLFEMPTLAVAERRLLAGLRARPDTSAPVLPATIDVPSFLDRPRTDPRADPMGE